MKMWVVYRDQPGHCRMYFCGVGLDFSSTPNACACWGDRRDADRAARELSECLEPPAPVMPDHWVFGTVCVDMPEADPTQYVPGSRGSDR
jgi:hypothetical protein